jgi:hypothetical protein
MAVLPSSIYPIRSQWRQKQSAAISQTLSVKD